LIIHGVEVVPPAKAGSTRIQAFDVVRGAALLCMFVYHGAFDLAFFGIVAPSFPFIWPMRMFSHLVASTFLALVGVSLSLAYSDRALGLGYLRRLAVLWSAACAISLATYAFAPGAYISFGILHCIAAASVLGGLATRAPAIAGYALGAMLLASPMLVEASGWHVAWPLWLGLSGQEPTTLDWRPFAPWGGVTMLACAAARSTWGLRSIKECSAWRSERRVARATAFLGRHSLAIYLVHQPIFFLGVMAYLRALELLSR